jgi:hypothetical protein
LRLDFARSASPQGLRRGIPGELEQFHCLLRSLRLYFFFLDLGSSPVPPQVEQGFLSTVPVPRQIGQGLPALFLVRLAIFVCHYSNRVNLFDAIQSQLRTKVLLKFTPSTQPL